MPSQEEARRFLELVHGPEPYGDLRSVVWTPSGRRSKWCQDPQEAAEAACHFDSGGADAYVCASLQLPGYGGHRGTIKGARAIGAVWCDLDFFKPGSKKKYPTREQAIEIVAELPLKPSAALETGGGWHLWWVLKERWDISTGPEKARAREVIDGWHGNIANRLAAIGCDLDPTADLARVMRICGTNNHKYGPNSPIRLNEWAGPLSWGTQYNPSDFEDWLETRGKPSASKNDKPTEDEKEPIQGDDLERITAVVSKTISGDVKPPPGFYEALTAYPDFAATWERRRDEFPSQSEYDLSIANFCVALGWDEKQTASVLYIHRHMGAQDTCLKNPQKYARTIIKAQRSRDPGTAENLSSTPRPFQDGKPKEDPESKRQRISNVLSLRVDRVVITRTASPLYRIEGSVGSDAFRVGPFGARQFLTIAAFRVLWFEKTGRVLSKIKQKEWDAVVQMMADVAVDEHVGDEGSVDSIVLGFLGEFLRSRAPTQEKADACAMRHPFWSDGDVSMFLQPFLEFLPLELSRELKRSGVVATLRARGCKVDRVHVEVIGGGRTTVSTWRVPAAVAESLDVRPPKGG